MVGTYQLQTSAPNMFDRVWLCSFVARAEPGEVGIGEQARQDIEEMVFAEVEVARRIGGSG